MDLIKIAEEAFATGKQHPSFKAGDTVTVAYRIDVSRRCYQNLRTWRKETLYSSQNVGNNRR